MNSLHDQVRHVNGRCTSERAIDILHEHHMIMSHASTGFTLPGSLAGLYGPPRKTYFIRRRGRMAGPYTKDELRSRELEPHTRVWDEDLFTWVDAVTVEALGDLFLDRPRRVEAKKSFWQWLGIGFRHA